MLEWNSVVMYLSSHADYGVAHYKLRLMGIDFQICDSIAKCSIQLLIPMYHVYWGEGTLLDNNVRQLLTGLLSHS